MSPVRRGKHAVYDLKYHFVWIPKYRKNLFTKELEEFTKRVFEEIAKEYDFKIDTMEVGLNHVHMFMEVPPRYSPSEVVQIMKSISARELFKRFPEIKKQLWSGKLWSDGYFVRSVGDKVTTEVIQKYIKYHHDDQLDLSF